MLTWQLKKSQLPKPKHKLLLIKKEAKVVALRLKRFQLMS
jgi:hypothetical protein